MPDLLKGPIIVLPVIMIVPGCGPPLLPAMLRIGVHSTEEYIRLLVIVTFSTVARTEGPPPLISIPFGGSFQLRSVLAMMFLSMVMLFTDRN